MSMNKCKIQNSYTPTWTGEKGLHMNASPSSLEFPGEWTASKLNLNNKGDEMKKEKSHSIEENGKSADKLELLNKAKKCLSLVFHLE